MRHILTIFSRRFLTTTPKTTELAIRECTKMRLDSPKFHALFTPELTKLSELFARNGFELRMAGGAVRDLLMGQKPADVDFATDATPEQMKELFTRENVRMFNKRGEEHGTITCRINDKENFEITTLRIDVVCDGRRASVKFTKSWEQDAFRRDLTINSLFLDLDGQVHDYTGGIEDIRKRRIAFVGCPVTRLQEDYLRILRYFRFFGRFAPLDAPHEPANLEAIVQCREGLKSISGERLWMELHRILVGRMAASLLRTMLVDCGLGPFLAIPSTRCDELDRLSAANAPNGLEGPLQVEPSTALAALFDSAAQAGLFQSRCKCSNAERTLCELIVERRAEAAEQRHDLGWFKRSVLEQVFQRGGELKDQVLHQHVELFKYIGEAGSELCKQLECWDVDKFPVGGVDLLQAKVPKGPRMRSTLRHLFNLWLASDLQMSREELLEHVRDEAEIARLEAEMGGKKRKWRPPMKRKHSKGENGIGTGSDG